MRQLGERQAAAKKRLDELRKKLGQGAPQSGQPGTQSGEGQPMSVPGLDDGLGQAGKHMQSAEGQLRGGKPREAEGEESQALEALGKAREQVQRERRPGNEEGGQAMDRDPVKIPGADEYQAPREFREDILDAMKRAAPERYKQQVRRYFEELVR